MMRSYGRILAPVMLDGVVSDIFVRDVRSSVSAPPALHASAETDDAVERDVELGVGRVSNILTMGERKLFTEGTDTSTHGSSDIVSIENKHLRTTSWSRMQIGYMGVTPSSASHSDAEPG